MGLTRRKEVLGGPNSRFLLHFSYVNSGKADLSFTE